jgi:hypothetical protein
MKCRPFSCRKVLSILLFTLAGCATHGPAPVSLDPPPPISAETWREIKEEIWTASTLAQSDAETYARQAMRQWMQRVRENTENEFVPWYSGYWAQQWIGLKAGWYEMSKDADEGPVEDYLVSYLQEKFYELVLEPASTETDPQTISAQAAARFVRLLSEQLQCLPETHGVAPASLEKKLEEITLILLPGPPSQSAFLSQVFEHQDLTGVPAYEALITHSNAIGDQQRTGPREDRLQVVAEDSVTRLVAQLPVRAGGSTVAMVVGEVVGLFISAGVAAWSAISHNRDKPEIESQLRQALDTGLNDMWQILMENPQLGVLAPVNHMNRAIEMCLFPSRMHDPTLPF